MKTYPNILITGSYGYVGSFLARAFPGALLLDKSYDENDMTIFDNVKYCDFRDRQHSFEICNSRCIDTVIHTASYVSVADSIKCPLEYYLNNIACLNNVLSALPYANHIFLSSVTAYDYDNPYAESKRMCERILSDSAKRSYAILRLANVAGASADGFHGFIRKNSTHLIETLARIVGTDEVFKIYGTDYLTIRGTAAKDYVWIEDVVNAVRVAVFRLDKARKSNKVEKIKANVVSGELWEVQDIIDIFNCETGEDILCETLPRRDGDTKSDKPLGEKFTDNWVTDGDIIQIVKSMLKFKKESYELF